MTVFVRFGAILSLTLRCSTKKSRSCNAKISLHFACDLALFGLRAEGSSSKPVDGNTDVC